MNKISVLSGAILAAFAGSASAAAFQLLEQNASGIGTAYAGSAAVADNASTIFYNPAGMTLLPARQVSLGVAGVGTNVEFSNKGTNFAGAAPTGGEGGNAGGWNAVPNAYLSWALDPQWVVGLGISSPFGLDTNYDSDWMGRYQSIEAKVRTVNINPSVAFKASEKVSLGFGLNYQKMNAKLTSAVPVAGVDQTQSLEGDDTAWGWNAGALFTLSPAMRVGVAYRSEMKYTLDGTAKVSGGVLDSDAKADIRLPGTFTLSVWQQVSDRWEAMGDLSYTNWDSLDTVKVKLDNGTSIDEVFGYRNSWRFAWGAAYKYSDAWKAKFGVAYDRTPTTNADRSARVPDGHRVWFSLGGQYKPSKTSVLDFGYAYVWIKDPTVEQSQATSAGTSVLKGDYDDSGHVLGVQFSQSF